MPVPYPIDLTTDGHIHTYLCNHAVGSMEEYVLAALQKNLKSICFLEHMETGINYYKQAWLSDEDFTGYFTEGKRLQRIYGNRLAIALGVELGYNREHRAQIVQRVGQYSWDKIGISCHFLKVGEGHHLNLLSRDQVNIDIARKLGPDRILTEYYNQLIEAVDLLPGTHLCHLDAALRHLPELELKQDHYDRIETLLGKVKEKGMVLEINASGFRHRGQAYPAPQILAMAIELAIPLSAGSDAHRPEDVGSDFDKIEEYITAALLS